MNEFNGFSPAARLYAENISLIQEVARAYDESISAFLSVLEQEIQRRVAPTGFKPYSPKGSKSRYWMLGSGDYEASAYLWFLRQPDYLDPTGLWCLAHIGADSTVEQREAVASLANNGALDLDRARDGNALWGLAVDFEETDATRLVEATAERLALVLREMTDAYQRAAPKGA